MKNRNGWLIFLSGGSMALIWRYAWVNFITIAAFHRPFPLPEAIGTLALASLLYFIYSGKGWRIISILCLQVLGFSLAFLRTVYVFSVWSYNFLNPRWLSEFINRSKGPLEWLSLILILILTLLFWFGGVLLARRPREHRNMCAQFDIGVSLFFLLFLIKFLLLVKWDIQIHDPLTEPCLISFFLFSLLALALSRNQGHAQKEFLPGYKGIGVTLSFALVVLVVGTGVVSLFLPYLSMTAKAGLAVLKTAVNPLGPVAVSVLRFLFAPRTIRQAPAEPQHKWGIEDSDTAFAFGRGPFDETLRYLVIGLVVAMALVVVILLLWLLLKWLFSKTSFPPKQGGGRGGWNLLHILAAAWRAFLRCCRTIAGLWRQRKKGAIQLYAALLRWGSRGGLPRFLSETPAEYGGRLKQHFPAVTREVESIIEVFNQTVYGGIVLDHQQLALAQAAWRTLCSPLYWVRYLKQWFLGPAMGKNLFEKKPYFSQTERTKDQQP